jgi:hypothetical protein
MVVIVGRPANVGLLRDDAVGLKINRGGIVDFCLIGQSAAVVAE